MQIKTRTKFPETWIWDTVTTDSNGAAQLTNLTVPDTITSWIVTAFSMSADKGLGLDASAEKIVAFQNFFIKLYLPYSVKVGYRKS
jgi:CD109 antigen